MDIPVIRQRRTPPTGLGATLRSAREQLGLSQGAVALTVGVRPDYVSKLERGLRCPSVSVADSLVLVLELNDTARAALLAAAVTDAGRDHPGRQAA